MNGAIFYPVPDVGAGHGAALELARQIAITRNRAPAEAVAAFARLEEILEGVVPLAEDSPLGRLRRWATSGNVWALGRLGRGGEASRWIEAALVAGRSTDDWAALADLHCGRVLIAWRDGRIQEALEHAVTAREFAGRDRSGRLDALARSSNQLGLCYWQLGDRERAAREFEAGLRAARAMGDRHTECSCVQNLGILTEQLNRHADAAELYREAVALAEELGEARAKADALCNLGLAERRMGRLDSASDHLRAALEAGGPTGDGLQLLYINIVLADVCLERGDFAEADRLLATVGASLPAYGSHVYEIDCLLVLVRRFVAAAGAGAATAEEEAIAAQHLTKALQLAESGQPVARGRVHERAYEFHKACGRAGQALQHLETFLQLTREALQTDAEERVLKLKVLHDLEAARAVAAVERSRAEELRSLNAELGAQREALAVEIAARQATERERLALSRAAGMAAVAADVLHNAGNVLCSVNVAVASALERVRQSRGRSVAQVAELLGQAGDLGEFLTVHPRGKLVPGYLKLLGEQLSQEKAEIESLLVGAAEHVAGLNHVINQQQQHARAGFGVCEEVEVRALVAGAVRYHVVATPVGQAAVQTALQSAAKVNVDAHKVTIILDHLLVNAQEAVQHLAQDARRIEVEVVETETGWVEVRVRDNGVGFISADVERLFGQGFSTKGKGRGFGLHSSRNLALELKGGLTAASAGPGCGAVFTLRLPIVAG